MITKEDLRNERVWACGEWYDKFVLDFPSGVETTPDGWLSLIRAGYGPVISWLLINTDDEIFRPNLRGADLSGTNLGGTDLHGAKYKSKTIFPDGFDPIISGMIERN